MKSSFLATKSVSQLTSTTAPVLPSAAMYNPIRPSAVTRVAALLALLPSLIRRISSARAMSPSASASAFLHSIMGASVFSRSSLTIDAVICATIFSSSVKHAPGLPGHASVKAGPLHDGRAQLTRRGLPRPRRTLPDLQQLLQPDRSGAVHGLQGRRQPCHERTEQLPWPSHRYQE